MNVFPGGGRRLIPMFIGPNQYRMLNRLNCRFGGLPEHYHLANAKIVKKDKPYG